MSQVANHLLFLASPGDVGKERVSVEAVVSELNRSVAAAHAIALRVVAWEHDSYPGYGNDAQAIINSQIAEMARYSLFVGIMWNRIGTPTPRSPSGTVEEFNLAVQAHRQFGQPEIWLYFRESAARLSTHEQLEQKRQVLSFREDVQRHGLPRGYSTPSAFKEMFRQHLTLWLGASSRSRERKELALAGGPSEGQRSAKATQLLAALSANCSKARALQIEDELYSLFRDDVESFLESANQYVAPAREAMAVVGGRLLHAGLRDQRIVDLLLKFSRDPDLWVRRKAQAGLQLAGY